MGKKRECGMREGQRVKGGIENAGETCGTTGNKREYKMRDLIATTARCLERNTDDVLFHKGSPSVILCK